MERAYLRGEITLEEYVKLYYLKRRNPFLYLILRIRYLL
jgi:hypothetical protein